MPHASKASHAQQAIWLAPDFNARPGPYNLLWSLQFHGPLETGQLRWALTEMVRRHDVLRANFHWNGLYLEQGVRPAADIELSLCAHAAYEIAVEANRAFGEAPYDLAKGPLYRFRLVRQQPEQHLLLCGFHHMVMDGTSWSLFAAELTSLLVGAELPSPPLQYADHAAAHATALARGDGATARAYWRNRAHAHPTVWEMPVDEPQARRDSCGGVIVSLLASALAGKLCDAAERMETTPFRTALAAFAAFLAIQTRRDEVVLATTLTGRPDPATRTILGMFVNTGIVSAEITEQTTFRELVRRTHAEIDAAVAHQALPFSLAVQDVAVHSDRQRNPFTEVSFTRIPRAIDRHFGALRITDRRVFLTGTDRDLTVYFQRDGAGFQLAWIYRAGRFRQEVINRFDVQFQSVLAAAIAHPDVPLLQLDIISEADRRRILERLNDTDVAFPGQEALHRLFESQAARSPDAVAVMAPQRSWTYGQINAAANRLAQTLLARGIGSGHYVPIRMQPSAELLIAELAVLKCGAAFVPLAVDWPENRVAALLAQIDCSVLIVSDRAMVPLTMPNLAPLVMTEIGDGADPGNPRTDTGLDAPIYCIFTSGSTGTPKAAINCHRGIVNRLLSMTECFGSAAQDVVLATASSTTDTLVWQFFWPLICGGRVVVAPRGSVVSPDHLERLIRTKGVTVTDFVPSVFHGFLLHLRERQVQNIGPLRMILIGGEAMNAADVYAFKAMYPQVAIANTYGPTETSIGTIFHPVPDRHTSLMPIGRPFPNVRAVILSGDDRLTPFGITGELCLGGVCVGLGYLGDPKATRTKFIANHFPDLRCATLYRTGDLARMRPDGVIEYLGRIDDQINIRGVRIEPGEIEAALIRQTSVAEAVVSAGRDADGRPTHLVAHVVLARGAAPVDAADLRDALQQDLPAHMLPSVFIRADALPLALSGKIDRAATAVLPGDILSGAKPHEGPRNDFERHLTAIWCELLEIASCSIHDNFFVDLGGDSLLVMRFVLLLEERIGIEVEAHQVFETPTVAALAARLAADRERAASARQLMLHAEDMPLEMILERQRHFLVNWKGVQMAPESFLYVQNPQGSRHPLFWCFQGFEELSKLALYLGPDQPVVGMRSGHVIMRYTDRNVNALAANYAQEICHAQPEGSIHLGGNCQGGVIARSVALELRRMERKVDLLVLMEETDFAPYDGKVALLFGRDSHQNPFNSGKDPWPVFRDAYPDGPSVDLIPGAHGEFFRDRNGPTLAAIVANLLRQLAPSDLAILFCREQQVVFSSG